MRLNLALLLALLASAFYLVHVQYQSRRLYTELDQAVSRAQRLDAEHEQWVVQKRKQATPGRVQKMVVEQLRMRSPTPAITQYVNDPAQKGAP